MTKRVSEIRKAFLEYFKNNDHQVVSSAPLVPHDDDSLMFVNAGMVQFKNYFTGIEKPKFKRAVSSQKCVRAGGKHNDLENVGYTARHHTFFEMLGNFSFGDYFKEEAIYHAWEFVTKELGLPKEKLIATIYHNDEEAFNLWKKISSIPEDKIIRIDTSDNFWSMGDTGPCGPCSEIFYDHGDHIKGNPPGQGDEGDRFIEIWNLVFMQFNKLANGNMENLPNPAIDTGMGLERMAAIMQGKHNNFEVELFSNIINKSQEITGKDHLQYLTSHRVIADHLRAISFLISDGVLPLNEGRGYVLRRVMRRAMRHVHQIGYNKPLLSQLFPVLLNEMGGHYEELHKASNLIIDTITNEEKKFGKTLDKGLKILEEEIDKSQGKNSLSGEVAFKLYDTYGFPIDLTADIIKEKGLEVDYQEFDNLMEEQKLRGKLNWQGSGATKDNNIWFELNDELDKISFVGYDNDQISSEIISICDLNGQRFDEISDQDQESIIITKETPFYAESGGQIGDTGRIISDAGVFAVKDTKKVGRDLIIHIGNIQTGKISNSSTVKLEIDNQRRDRIRSNHSATHLLHSALQAKLGDHITQRGSYVSEEILRFDFTHNKAVSKEEIIEIEKLVNSVIRNNGKVDTSVMEVEEAKKKGAKALFGEKYDQKVRVLSIGQNAEDVPFSQELCGGTHVSRSGDIGMFKIINEGSIASGIRRIEAITGQRCLSYIQSQEEILNKVANLLKSSKEDIENNIESLITNKRKLEKDVSNIKQKLSLNISPEEVLKVERFQILIKILEDLTAKDARELTLKLKNNDIPIIITLAKTNGKVSVIVSVNRELSSDINASDIVKHIVEILGGKGGGGKADFAQGGGNSPENIPQVKKWAERYFSSLKS